MAETEDYAKSATPSAHGPTHEKDGSDEVSVAGLAGELAASQKSTWTLVSGKPTSFTPAAHVVTHEVTGSDELNVNGLPGTLADPQPIYTHKDTHNNAGSDEISVEGLSGQLADPQTSLFQKARAYCNTGQVIPAAALTKININTVTFDPAGIVDIVNYRIKPTKAGYYSVAGNICFVAGQNGITSSTILKNGVQDIRGAQIDLAGLGAYVYALNVAGLVYLNGTTDYVELFVYQTNGATLQNGVQFNFLSLLGPF